MRMRMRRMMRSSMRIGLGVGFRSGSGGIDVRRRVGVGWPPWQPASGPLANPACPSDWQPADH